ncbi:RE2 [Symbiodinium sp. CCMP2592]|nr:RE2 [Symbiodinium sp. CCMP2592]
MAADDGVAASQPGADASEPADPWAGWTGVQNQPATETTTQPTQQNNTGNADESGEAFVDESQWPSWEQAEWDDSSWGHYSSWSHGDQWSRGGGWQRDQWSDARSHGHPREWWSDDGHEDRWSDGSHHGWRDHQHGSNASTTTPSTDWGGGWRQHAGHDPPEVGQRRDWHDSGPHAREHDEKKGMISERMAVPSFSAEGVGEELGQSARSYLRQVEAWTKVTRTPASQRALLLYQNLTGRAWVESEELQVSDLAKDDGLDVFKRWVQERYQEVEVSKIAESLTCFFKRLRRQPGQSIREFNSLFDRAHTRLLEIECRLPEVAKAWAYLNALGLAHNEELALLASVNNDYHTTKLQRAATLHEKSLKAPWSFRKPGTGTFDKTKGPRAAYMTDIHDEEDEPDNLDEEILPEEVAMEVHEAFMAHESAKARLREVTKNRGVDMEAAKGTGGDKSPEERLRLAKSRSFCAGCKRRGHWHRDPECPLNSGKNGDNKPKVQDGRQDKGVRDSFVVYVAFEVGEVGIREGLVGITDCACSRSVCGQEWMERYLNQAKKENVPHPFLPCCEEFRFGASKGFKATYAVLVFITLQHRTFVIKVAVVDGDVPLLLSRAVLGKLGMVYDIERHEADFRALGIDKYKLSLTNTGHPAIPVSPKKLPSHVLSSTEGWKDEEVRIASQAVEQYTVFMTSSIAAVSDDVLYEGSDPVVLRSDPQSLHEGTSVEVPEDTYEAPIFFSKKLAHVHGPEYTLFPGVLVLIRENGRLLLSTTKKYSSNTSATSEVLSVYRAIPIDLLNPSIMFGVKCLSRRLRFGSGRAFSRSAPLTSTLLLQPMAKESKGIWSMTKAELIKLASEESIVCHSSWTCGEIRSVIQEKRQAGGSSVPRGLGNMTLDDLKSKMVELGLEMPTRPTKGQLAKIIRDSTKSADEEVVNFGRYVNHLYKEVPEGYLRWAVRETEANSNSSMDLRKLANYAREKFSRSEKIDPEVNAMVKYDPSEFDVKSEGYPSKWSVVSAATGSQQPIAPKATTPPPKKSRDRNDDRTKESMEQEIPLEVREQLRNLDEKDYVFGKDAGERSPEISGPVDQDRGGFSMFDGSHKLLTERDGAAALVRGDSVFSDPHYFVSGNIEFSEPTFDPEVDYQDCVEGVDLPKSHVHHDKPTDDTCQECFEEHVQAAQDVESLAKELLKVGDFSADACRELAAKLCLWQGACRRKMMNGTGRAVALGAFTHGGIHGVINNTYNLKATLRYLNKFLKIKGAKGRWSSLSVTLNAQPGLHRDAHNMDSNQSISLGPTVGGRLWIEDPKDELRGEYHIVKLADGRTIEGKYVSTQDQVVSFDPHRRHFVEDWDGIRVSVTAYTVRGIEHLSTEERDLLRARGFPVHAAPRQESTGNSYRKESETRPRSSVRKGLWKNALKASAMLTMTMTAATSYLSENFARPSAEQVALLEIGGAEHTYYATEIGAMVSEPLDHDFVYEHGAHQVCEHINEVKPRVVWIHPPGPDEKSYVNYQKIVEAQINEGGIVVCEANKNDVWWNNPNFNNESLRAGRETYDSDGRVRLRIGPTENVIETAYVVEGGEKRKRTDEENKKGASAIKFDAKVAPHVRAALTRLHQNLGHPAVHDLVRHLRLAGAEGAVIAAAKSLKCEVCERCQRTAASRPATLPTMLDFNQIVAVDVFHAFDTEQVRHEFLSVIDLGTQYHVVKEISGHSSQDFEMNFIDVWSRTFGTPSVIAADLETGLQAGLAKYAEFSGAKLRSSAAQAHFQQGVVERHGQWWQDIFAKVVDDQTITSDDVFLAVAAVNNAKNNLCRRHGYSPSQAVFGRDTPAPEDLCQGNDEEMTLDIMTTDKRRQREVAVRTAARLAFFRSQVDIKLRRSLIQRARVKKTEYSPGEMVCFFRYDKASTKRGRWRGPGLILGREGPNWWVSYAGRCHLCAEEHMRPSTAEEVGQAFTSKVARADLEKLLFSDPHDPNGYAHSDEEPGEEPGDNEGEPQGVDEDMLEDISVDGEEKNQDGVTEQIGDEEIDQMLSEPFDYKEEEPRVERRARHKQAGPQSASRSALTILTKAESDVIYDTVEERILNSRWAYKDKNYSKRKADNTVEWKAKARLVIAGHRDPDVMNLTTDAPTVNRLSVLVLLQFVASARRDPDPWEAAAGDVSAAFLNGKPLQRVLYMKQPRTGVDGMEPGALFKVEKGIFGLPDSPHSWWVEFQEIVFRTEFTYGGRSYTLKQSPVDPCVFLVKCAGDSKPHAYLAVHVDDLLTVGPKGLSKALRAALDSELPIDEWEIDNFDYIGSRITVDDEGVKISQSHYAPTRLFHIEVDKSDPDDKPASFEQKVDNQSLIGGLSWLAGQTRPDIQSAVSLAQQAQKTPTVGDIRFTNGIAKKAIDFQDKGIQLRPLDLSKLEILVYHDAAWANALPIDLAGEDEFALSKEDHENGYMTQMPESFQVRKAKRANTKVASQYGLLVLLTESGVINDGRPVSIIDWKSTTAKRICRSTFAAETIACTDGVEVGQYARSFVRCLLDGHLSSVEKLGGTSLRFITDCKSLYDHLHREGIPRVPTDRRLAIDLAALRHALNDERRDGTIPLSWLPTSFQLADILTKPLGPSDFWAKTESSIRIPLVTNAKF